MATLNHLIGDWLKCGLLCFCAPPVPLVFRDKKKKSWGKLLERNKKAKRLSECICKRGLGSSDKRQKSRVRRSSSVCSVLFISGGLLSSWHLARVSRTQKLTAGWQLEPRLLGRGTAECRVIRVKGKFHQFSSFRPCCRPSCLTPAS